jgi:hypothetical protein
MSLELPAGSAVEDVQAQAVAQLRAQENRTWTDLSLQTILTTDSPGISRYTFTYWADDASSSDCTFHSRANALSSSVRVASLNGVLRPAVRIGRTGRKSVSDALDRGGELVVGIDPGDQSRRYRLGRGHAIGEQRHLQRAGAADRCGDECSGATVGHESDLRERQQEVAGLGGNGDVAGESEGDPHPGGRSVDRRDDGPGERPNSRHRTVRGIDGLGRRVGRQVGSGAERLSGPGDRGRVPR